MDSNPLRLVARIPSCRHDRAFFSGRWRKLFFELDPGPGSPLLPPWSAGEGQIRRGQEPNLGVGFGFICSR